MKKWVLSLLLVLLLVSPAWAGVTRVDALHVEDTFSDTASNQTQGQNDAYIKGQLEVDGAVRFDATTLTLRGIAYTLPSADGTASYVLSTNGSGTLSWASPGTGNTLDAAYDQGGVGTGRAIVVDGGAVTLTGNAADNNNVLEITKSPSGAQSGKGLLITMGANDTGAGIGFANTGSGADLLGSGSTWSMSKAGALVCASLTPTTLYQSAIASAASGNTALTVDAAGNGAITIGGISTGNIAVGQAAGTLTDYGNTVLGTNSSNTVTVNSKVISDVNLNKGASNSPQLIFTDGATETAIFKKTNSGNFGLTTTATEGLVVTPGNVSVGSGTPGTVPMTGGNLYVTNASEFGGAEQFNGNITVGSSVMTVNATSGNTVVTGTLATTGITTATGAIYANGGIDRGSAAALVIGGSLANAVTITPPTTVTGALYANGGLDRSSVAGLAIGAVYANAVTISPATTCSSTLKSTGDFNVNTSKFTVAASTGNTTVAGTLGVSGLTSLMAVNTISAAGTNQATATQLTGTINNVTTAAANTGVNLPTSVAGMLVEISNSGANPLHVYPVQGGSETINGIAAATGVVQMVNSVTTYYCPAAGTWLAMAPGQGYATGKYPTLNFTNAITASGSTQSDATVLSNTLNRITTCAAGNGVALPASIAGMYIVVSNSGAATLSLYPVNGGSETINGMTANVPYLVPVQSTILLTCTVAGTWQSTKTNPVVLNAYNTNTATAGATLTVANVSGAPDVVLDLTGTLGGDANAQLPTVANLVAVIPNLVAGNTYRLRIINDSSANHVWTVTTNTGWSALTGTMTIAQYTWRDFIVTLTSTSAAALQAIGTGTQS